MRLFYNILQILIVPLLFLLSPFFILLRPEKSKKILNRLGLGLSTILEHNHDKPVVWIHALSVGEVVSVIPLVQALRNLNPNVYIVFSATTTSGKKLADTKVSPFADAIIHFPLDFYPVVTYFINRIKPDLFILVETDFWPNLLYTLSSKNVPILLVNGRISEKSMQSYRKFSFFFRPMFNRFNAICMQTTLDSDNMNHLGIRREKIKTLGNLKYALVENSQSARSIPFTIADQQLLIICGSTHPGEEDIILNAYKTLREKHDRVHLLIAPRDITRSHELKTMSESFGFTASYYSSKHNSLPDCLIIDTIGDLVYLYSIADIAFIGGSLINLGGHNPLEAARHGVPTMFGPHMDNFSEISRELLDNKASIQILNGQDLASELDNLISSESLRQETGNNGIKCLNLYKNVIENHLVIINNYL